MKISTISDVHIRFPGDAAESLLLNFLKHPLVLESNYVALLGDIFDLMCGPHEVYLTQFREIFEAIDALVERGIQVIYIEGNHDVHLKKLFFKRWKNDEVILSQSSITLQSDQKSYYLSHGDDHEVDNLTYQRYKKIIFSPPLRFFANYILPYKVLEFFGRLASKQSRKKGSKIFDASKVKSRFRTGVTTTNPPCDFIIGGHSHVKDEFILPSGAIYLNNGYAPTEKIFIHLDNDQYSFVSL